MKPKKRQKLCHNCEGEIDLDVIVCPFCAADLREEKPEQAYSPFVTTSSVLSQKESVQSLYPNMNLDIDAQEDSEDGSFSESPKIEEDKKAGVVLPIMLFTLGAQLFVLSLLMALFSSKGVIILKWDARFWFFYLFASVPFLIFGYKSLSKL